MYYNMVIFDVFGFFVVLNCYILIGIRLGKILKLYIWQNYKEKKVYMK